MRPDRSLRLACLLLGLGLSFAGCTQPPSWELQAWGSPATQVSAGPDDACRQGDVTGWRFAKTKQGGGDAELILPRVLQPGQAYEFSVQIKALGQGAAVRADLAFRRDTPFYETTSIRALTLPAGGAWQTVTLRGRYTSVATGSVRLGLRGEGVAVCVASPVLKAWNGRNDGTAAVAVPDTFFGVHLNKLGRHNGWPSFNPGVLRMWSTGTTWTEVQPAPEPIDWLRNVHAQRLDYFVRHVQRQSGDHQMIMTLGMTPPWAAAPGNASACAHSAFGPQTCMPVADLENWRRYVRELAQRYGDSPIRIWELWNEADVSTHWVGGAGAMVEMVRIAREEIRKVQPDAVLIGPNVTSMGMRFLSDFLVAGGGRYIDGVSVHVYVGRQPARALDQVRNVRDLVRDHGLNLPIWNTETNTACGGGPASDRLLEQANCTMQAEAAVAQFMMGQAALGVRNVSYYTWEGAELDVAGVGLVEADFRTVTPMGVMFERMAALLKGAQAAWMPMPGWQGAQAVQFSRPDGVCKVAWAEGEPMMVAAQDMGAWTWARRFDGTAVTVDAAGRVPLGAMPVAWCKGAQGW